MSGVKGNKALIFNMIIPIFIGGVIYYIMSPNVLFVKLIDGLIGESLHIFQVYEDNVILRVIRNYFLDMLWGYALVFALYFILDDAEKSKRIFLMAFVFSVLMEILQLTPFAEGTFDFLDILLEFVSEVFAIFIIKIHYGSQGTSIYHI
jgi:hypothetical protein